MTKRDGESGPGTETLASPGKPASLLLPQRWVIEDGPDQGRELVVTAATANVGSAPDSDLRLADPSVSGRHATLRCTPQGLVLTDVGSRNGTFLDDNRVMQAFIAPGARVRVGRTTLRLRPQDGASAPAEGEQELGGLVARSAAMRSVFALLKRVAPGEITVVITGETGTGKDLAARAIHALSQRSARPFAVLDCSALDRELVSAELFGHEAGAFTGATHARPGLFEQANGGTVFLDEVGELPLDLQPKLLRALEQREVRRLGSSKTVRFDCRLIAATHRDLLEMVAAGRFRQDLYYRLAQVMITLPPLRDRGEDVELIATHLLARLSTAKGGPSRFGDDALAALRAGAFAGNVRELKNVVERAHLVADGDAIRASDLSLQPLAVSGAAAPEAAGRATAPRGRLESAEREAIAQTLREHGFNRARTAAALGLSLPTLRKRIRDLGIEVPAKD